MIWFIGNFYFSIGYSQEKRRWRDHLLNFIKEEGKDGGGK